MNYRIAFIAFILCYFYIGYAHSNDDRQAVIDNIIRKVCNIAKSSLSKAKSPKEIDKILRNIEIKMLRSTGDGEADNVKLIVQGVKAMARVNDFHRCSQRVSNNFSPKNNLRNGTLTENHAIDNNTAKQNLLKEMELKIEKLASKSFQNTTSEDNKLQILENIQKRLIETVKQKDNASGSNRTKTDSYVSLIMDGVKHVMDKTANGSRRMAITEFNGKPEKEKLEADDVLNQVDSKNEINIESTTHGGLRSLTTEVECTVRAERICSNLKSLNEFLCTYDDTVIPLEHVCDGAVACPDDSDEKNCAVHAVERVHSATRIITSIENSRECFSELISSKHLEDQEKLLNSFLQQQLDFIKKHGKNNAEMYEYYGKNESIVDVAGDVLTVVRSFAMILKAALCDVSIEEADHILVSYDHDLEKDFENTVLIGNWYPKSCICSNHLCKDPACPQFCKRLCFQKNSLRQWSCQTINKIASLPLDLVCDGKLDCFDESDEMDCAQDSSSKFEASSIFGNVITELTVKSKLKEYEPIWKHLTSLQEAIKKVQEFSMKPKINLPTYKADRDKIFIILSSTYVEFVDHNRDLEKSEPVYKFLIHISEKLIGALKRSQMGNEKVISDDECNCRGTKCSTQFCSKKCTTICSVTPVLTTYACGSTNTSVTIDTVCNGKENCPTGEDEVNCKTEMCRAHHLKVLRHNIQNVGKKHSGTILGEVLDAWKAKANSRLLIAEQRVRPTSEIVRKAVKNILSDLVKAFSSLEEIKRKKIFNAKDTLKKFKKLSQRIIETLKSCAM